MKSGRFNTAERKKEHMSKILDEQLELGRLAGGDGRVHLQVHTNSNAPDDASVSIWVSFANGVSRTFDGKSLGQAFERAYAYVRLSREAVLSESIKRDSTELAELIRS